MMKDPETLKSLRYSFKFFFFFFFFDNMFSRSRSEKRLATDCLGCK